MNRIATLALCFVIAAIPADIIVVNSRNLIDTLAFLDVVGTVDDTTDLI